MYVELAGPYRDMKTGKVIDDDLLRIMLSRHRVCRDLGRDRLLVGQCRPSTGAVTYFRHYELNDRERQEIIDWAKELMAEGVANVDANERGDSGG